ncbi:MAG: 30S ribosomal protein S7 [Alphaproteobacteria bacterium]|uniref:30S ribosomal protein S7 n=1 Tax=Pararhizobium sp. IMCC21322 TaxID=3067903 RepID=UPI00274251EB|nr:30S ribosomal protein S7 [Pararhizobium sp. IMCC21322]MCR9239707.1 30S ribosomal protein S7 [Alphaproteobacteria bacterium]
MSRRHRAEKRDIIPDPKFGDVVLSKFMNSVMQDGKKSAAESIVYGAMDIMSAKTSQDPVVLFHQALENVMPQVEVRSRRVGGATYQVPVEVRNERRQALAIRWLIIAARKRNETTMIDRLSGELLDAANNRGSAVKKREDTHKMADANKAFSHYRW